MKLGPDDFAGRWRLDREITDMRILENGNMQGEATFTPVESGLHYREAGTLIFAGGPPVKAERSYFWRFSGGRVEVDYADHSPFHSFVLEGAPQAAPHLCGEDMYKGTYSFVAFPEWQVVWNVLGPKKNYRSVTRYRPV